MINYLPLYIEVFFDKSFLGSATGFIIKHKDQRYLVTAAHTFTGRHSETGRLISKEGAIPNRIEVHYHTSLSGSSRVIVSHEILKDSKKRWVEHVEGSRYDVAFLAVEQDLNDTVVGTVSLGQEMITRDMIVSLPDKVFVAGYPYGEKANNFPIWKTGNIASDPDDNYQGFPMFLIDATTKKGMSGSPVMAIKETYQASDGTTKLTPGGQYKFLGIYSGRHSEDKLPDIGRVWKASVVTDILIKLDDES